jgi:hypothetical protein
VLLAEHALVRARDRTASSTTVTGVPSAFAVASTPRSNAGSVIASAASASESASARSSAIPET